VCGRRGSRECGIWRPTCFVSQSWTEQVSSSSPRVVNPAVASVSRYLQDAAPGTRFDASPLSGLRRSEISFPLAGD